MKHFFKKQTNKKHNFIQSCCLEEEKKKITTKLLHSVCNVLSSNTNTTVGVCDIHPSFPYSEPPWWGGGVGGAQEDSGQRESRGDGSDVRLKFNVQY